MTPRPEPEGRIQVQALSKRFRRYAQGRPQTLKEWVLGGLRPLRPEQVFWGLKDVSFEVAPGQTVGLIGHNGAGKSTLLRLIGGVGRPDGGAVRVQGRIGALLDLGAGFHPDLTGRENVYIVGVIAGLTRREVARRFDDIVAFAELEAFIDQPLRTYSSGMEMRLAFAVAAHTDPRILLIDEVLAVGDLAFQRKCIERIRRFREDGCTIVLVTHDVTLVRDLCDQVLWMRGGQLVAQGDPGAVVAQYVSEMSEETRRRTPDARAVGEQGPARRLGSREVEITAVRLTDALGLEVRDLRSGDPLRVELSYTAAEALPGAIFGISLSRAADGLICLDVDTASSGTAGPLPAGPGRAVLELGRLDLIGGDYWVNVGAYEAQWSYAYDYHWQTYPLTLRPRGSDPGKGIVAPPLSWEVSARERTR